jgi:hypothetical protein
MLATEIGTKRGEASAAAARTIISTDGFRQTSDSSCATVAPFSRDARIPARPVRHRNIKD